MKNKFFIKLLIIFLLGIVHIQAFAQLVTPPQVLDSLERKAKAKGTLTVIISLHSGSTSSDNLDLLKAKAKNANNLFLQRLDRYLKGKGTSLKQRASIHKIDTLNYSGAVLITVSEEELKAIRNFPGIEGITENLAVTPL